MFNQITIMGRLTKDVQAREVGQSTVYTFSVAVNRPMQKDKTDFFECQAWNGAGQAIANYCTKGTPILVSGQMQMDQFQAQDGTTKTIPRINVQNFSFLPKNDGGGMNQGGAGYGAQAPQQGSPLQNAMNRHRAMQQQGQQGRQYPNTGVPLTPVDMDMDDLPF